MLIYFVSQISNISGLYQVTCMEHIKFEQIISWISTVTIIYYYRMKYKWNKTTLKLASEPLRCCRAREAINSCSSLTLTLTLPQERDIEEGGRFICGGVDGTGAGAGGGGEGWWIKWWCWWWCMWCSSQEAVGTGPLQSITTSPTPDPPTPTPEPLLSLELWRLGGDGGQRFGRCGLLSSP